MTNEAFENQAAKEVTNASDSKFPQEIEVAFTLKLTVDDQSERDYWLVSGTTNVTLDAIADLMDVVGDNNSMLLKSVNGLTYAQIQHAFAEREV